MQMVCNIQCSTIRIWLVLFLCSYNFTSMYVPFPVDYKTSQITTMLSVIIGAVIMTGIRNFTSNSTLYIGGHSSLVKGMQHARSPEYHTIHLEFPMEFPHLLLAHTHVIIITIMIIIIIL